MRAQRLFAGQPPLLPIPHSGSAVTGSNSTAAGAGSGLGKFEGGVGPGPEDWTTLVDWLNGVRQRKRLLPDSLHIAVQLIAPFVAEQGTNRGKLQMVRFGSLLVAVQC